ncbi:MAG: TolC family protein [Planctomycetales bacterium]|nr:TolC family protein [Planctomycetales bacterium]
MAPAGSAWELELNQARQYALSNNKALNVVRRAPEEAATVIQSAEAVFDPVFGMSAAGGQLDRQFSNTIQTFGGLVGEQRSDFLRTSDNDFIGLSQRLRTGGVLSGGWSTDYLSLKPVGQFVLKNPAWYSQWSVRLEQPLLRGFGRQVNEAPIMIAYSEHNREQQQVRALANETLLAVDLAYWNAVGAYHAHRVYGEIVESARKMWERERELLKLGKGSIPNVAQAEEQYHDFQVDKVEALQTFDAAIRELLRLMGYPTSTECSLPLQTVPAGTSVEPHWHVALGKVWQRPEVQGQQAAVDAARITLETAMNGMRADLKLRLQYNITGLETQLDDAIRTMSDAEFDDWTVGLVFQHPLGKRADAAAVRAAMISLRREQLALEQADHNIVHELRGAYERILAEREIATLQTQRRKSAVSQFEASGELYESGRMNLLDQLQAQQIASDARIDEIRAMIRFNSAIAQWYYAQGDYVNCYQTCPMP